MKIHTLKIKSEFYSKVNSNQKNWELRYNDRDFQIGDLIHFDILDEEGKIINTSEDDDVLWEIGYILFSNKNKDKQPSFSGIEKNYCIMSIRPVIIEHRSRWLRNIYGK